LNIALTQIAAALTGRLSNLTDQQRRLLPLR
jgi:hypothetical protein